MAILSNYAIGDQPIEGYRLVGMLGRGQFGEVWKARETRSGRFVALKIIDLSFSSHALKELRALNLVKNLNHPHLIPIYTACLVDSSGREIPLHDPQALQSKRKLSMLVFAMGLGERSLFARLSELNPAGTPPASIRGIPVDELLGYMQGAAKGIDFLNRDDHGLGDGDGPIVHCDIKPDNLLVVAGEIQVADCGVAVVVTPDIRQTKAAGSPAYSAPELTGNKPVRGTDQYALAISYYELRTGRLPFDEQMGQLSIMLTHAEGRLDFSSPLLTQDEVRVLQWATSVRPKDRYPTCLDMVRQLERAVEGLAPMQPSDLASRPGPSQASMRPVAIRDTQTLSPSPLVEDRPTFGLRDTIIPPDAYTPPIQESDPRATLVPSIAEIPISTAEILGTVPAISLPESPTLPVSPPTAPTEASSGLPATSVSRADGQTPESPAGQKIVPSGLPILPNPNRPISRPDFEWTSITGIPRPRTPAGRLIAHQVFVCYRRGDSDDITNRMIDFMKGKFADGVIFFDLVEIDLGDKFPEVIRSAVASCKVFIAVIGKDWVTIADDDGQRRLDDPLDFVRLEIETALQRDIRVIPVLVRQARMPKQHQLPETIASLAFRHGMEVRSSGRDFPHDMQFLIDKLTQYLKE